MYTSISMTVYVIVGKLDIFKDSPKKKKTVIFNNYIQDR